MGEALLNLLVAKFLILCRKWIDRRREEELRCFELLLYSGKLRTTAS